MMHLLPYLGKYETYCVLGRPKRDVFVN